MRVALLLNYFLPKHAAGTEVYVGALAKSLRALGTEVCVLIPNYGESTDVKYMWEDVPVFQYSEPSIPTRAIQIGKDLPKGLSHVRRFFESWKPDIVHVHELAGSTGIRVQHLEIAQELGIRTVYTLHLASITCATGTLYQNESKRCDGKMGITKCSYCLLQKQTKRGWVAGILTALGLPWYTLGIDPRVNGGRVGTAVSGPMQIAKLQQQLKRLNAVVDQFIPITRWYERMLIQNGIPANKMTFIPQALPVPHAGQLQPRVGFKPLRAVRLLFVGRISHLKGIPLLLDAIRLTSPEEFQLTIVGSAVDTDFIARMKQRSQDLPHVQWRGKCSSSEVLTLMASHDILVLPSMFSEMSPLVIQEAFRMKLPVLGSHVYGIAELVQETENGQGWLFEMGNVESLYQALLRARKNLLASDFRSFSFPEPLEFDAVGSATHSLYEQILLPTNS